MNAKLCLPLFLFVTHILVPCNMAAELFTADWMDDAPARAFVHRRQLTLGKAW